jgi:primase-polymerase (primpol)-like protein
LIERAHAARNGAKFAALWRGDVSAYGGDNSAADLALCNLLVFWAGGDAARVARLFRRSGLYRRKWDERRGEMTYGDRTIATALGDGAESYSARRTG